MISNQSIDQSITDNDSNNTSTINETFNKMIYDLNTSLSKIKSLNKYNEIFIYLFDIFQVTGIFILTLGFSLDLNTYYWLIWVGIGFNIIATGLYIIIQINYKLSNDRLEIIENICKDIDNNNLYYMDIKLDKESFIKEVKDILDVNKSDKNKLFLKKNKLNNCNSIIIYLFNIIQLVSIFLIAFGSSNNSATENNTNGINNGVIIIRLGICLNFLALLLTAIQRNINLYTLIIKKLESINGQNYYYIKSNNISHHQESPTVASHPHTNSNGPLRLINPSRRESAGSGETKV
jgi:hypothetical protein